MAFRDKLRQVIKIKDTPHQIALSFALGVFWGISPFIGIHIIGALFTAWLLRLNKFVAFSGVAVSNPWTIVPIYSFCIWVGSKLTGVDQIIPEIDWSGITFMQILSEFKHLILPFIVGTTVVSVFSAIISYFIIHRTVIRYKSIYRADKDAS